MSKEKIAIFIALLVLGAFLGVAFNAYQNSKSQQAQKKIKNQGHLGKQASKADASNEAKPASTPQNWNLTAGKIVFPPASANGETINSFLTEVRKKAQSSDTLTLGKQCKPDLAIWKVKKGQTVTIKNTDRVTHYLRNDAQKFDISIPPNQEKQWLIKISKGEFGYRCDRNLGVVGVIVVQE